MGRVAAAVTALVIGAPLGVWSQEMVRPSLDGKGFQLVHGDRAVLASDEPRHDLPCEVEPLDPKLEFDLTFQAGYNATIPLATLAGPGNQLRVLFRITPLEGEHEPTYFRDRYTVPPIESGAEGEASLPGKYRLGPGRYRVDWLMRDRAERVCSRTWEIRAAAPEGFEELAAAPTANKVSEFEENPFFEEPPTARAAGKLLRVKLLVSFSPVNPSRVSLNSYDLRSVVSMLRAISREPSIGVFSVVAYNAQTERILFEDPEATKIDFPALGEAVQSNPNGMVDIQQLQDKRSGEKFLQALFEKHLSKSEHPPDAIIFLGPKVVFERNPTSGFLHSSERTRAPIFYFIYNRNPRSYPWRDAISSGLRGFSATEFDITTPKDFGSALRQVIRRLTRGGQASDS